MRFRRFIRNLLLLILIVAVFAGVGYYVYLQDLEQRREVYALSVDLAKGTAVSAALFDATRTAESDQPHYRQITLAPGELLLDVARRYNTTVEVLRMANKLREDVDAGNGGEVLIVPQGVSILIPPRSFQTYMAVTGDTLSTLALKFDVDIQVLQLDNPILAQRGINPGDVVFVAEVLR